MVTNKFYSVPELKLAHKKYHKELIKGKFSRKLFDLYGYCYVRSPFTNLEIRNYLNVWGKFFKKLEKRKINKFNPAELLNDIPKEIFAIVKDKKIINIVKKVVGKDIGLFRARIMLKDKFSERKVHLHEDFSYQIGFQNKMSLFMALSPINKKNGALTFYSGTHKFGYLGDAGEINNNLLDRNWHSFSPNMSPGDIIVMNSSTWHKSGKRTSNENRVLTDFIYQPAADYSTKKIISGNENIYKTFMNTDKLGNLISPYERTIKLAKSLFKSSRSIRLHNLNKKLEENIKIKKN